MFKVPEKFRIKTGTYGSDASYGNNGQFKIKSVKLRRELKVQASDGKGWEHVSVSLPHRCPTWEEMSAIKAMFWGDEDFVIQIHPEKENHVNQHPYCLHLWRKKDTNDYCEKPDKLLVGI